ncbi:hypothetical protein B0H19DRAFT_647163 [Mycena capillaripes]|nr:hypothetical protein B0H19DRAFT_647163 [Mycena capillaripes]
MNFHDFSALSWWVFPNGTVLLDRLILLYKQMAMKTAKSLSDSLNERLANQSPVHLPAFYANLDPDTIPCQHDLDTSSPSLDVISRLTSAYISLQALDSCADLPNDVYPLLWSRVWAWISFIDTYDVHVHCVCQSDASADTRIAKRLANRLYFLQTVERFRSHDKTRNLVNSADGVYTMVAEMWALYVERNLFANSKGVFPVVCPFLSSPLTPAQFDEIVDALGGTQFDLAALTVKHIELMVCNPKKRLTSNLWTLHGVLQFLTNASAQDFLSRPTFADRGLAKALVKTISSLACLAVAESQELTALCMDLLRWISIGDGVGLNEWVPTALRAGFLRAIVACTTHAAGPVNLEGCRVMLMRELTPSLVYYHVVRRLFKALGEVEAVDMSTTPLSAEWTAFIELAHTRLTMFKSFDHTRIMSSRECDSPTCNATDVGWHFGVCSGCRQRFYCSEGCQRVDWKEGGHNGVCSILSDEASETLGKRELSFLCALIQHDYPAQKNEFWLRELLSMHMLECAEFHNYVT